MLAGVMLLAITLLVYLPAVRGGFIWDDDAYVTLNRTLRSVDGLGRIWVHRGATPQYYPLVFTTFWIERHLWGLQPLGYHLVNVLLHGASAVLLWRVLRRLGLPGAWVAAAVFAVHPVHVESVAWVTERKNVLSGVFYLGAMLAYLQFLHWRDDGATPETPPSPPLSRGGTHRGDAGATPWVWYVVVLVLFAGALLSKTVTCSLPAALALLVWWQRGRLSWRDLWPLLPMLAMGLEGAWVTTEMEQHHVGASGPEWALTAMQRCLIAGRALWFYAGKLAVPWPLSFIYPRWQVDPGQAWQYLFPVGAIAVVAVLWLLRRRIGRGPLAAVLLFAGTLVPALGFINVYPMRYSFVADHFQYLASIALIVLAVAGLARVPGLTRLRVPLAVGWLVVLGVLTWRQGRVYADLETLWGDVLAKNPQAWIAHNNLGVELDERGRSTEAAGHFNEALRLKPDCQEAYNNWGNLLTKQGKYAEAVERYRQAISVRPEPFPEAHNNLGRTLFQLGRTDEAIAEYHEALRLKADYPLALTHLGMALARQGRPQEAREKYSEAIGLQADLPEAHFNLGVTLAKAGEAREAMAQYQEALRLWPGYAEAHSELGVMLAEQGRLEEAARHYAEAVRLRPDYLDAQYNLGQALTLQGKLPEAIAVYREIVRQQPKDAEARVALGDVLRRAGQVREAAEQYRQALQINPQLEAAQRGLKSSE